MRPAKMVVAATVALATTLSLTPVAGAQIEHEPDAAIEANLTPVPPLVRIAGDLFALVNGSYVRLDEGKAPDFASTGDVQRGEVDPNLAIQPGQPEDPTGSQVADNTGNTGSSKGGNAATPIVAWLAPLAVIGAVVGTIATVVRQHFPTGRLVLYFQPGEGLGHAIGR